MPVAVIIMTAAAQELPLVQATTLAELLQRRVRASPEREAYREFDRAAGRWRSYTWGEIGNLVDRWTRALQAEDLPLGSRVAILLANSVEHVCLDQAALALGLVCVPMHVIDNPENLAYVLRDSGASLLMVESADRWRTLAPFRTQLPQLRRVVYQGVGEGAAQDIARPLPRWLSGADQGGRADQPAAAPRSGATVEPESLAAIVYTSGTTGRPKGVMLSHRNVLADLESIVAAIPVREDDVFLSFLPLSHTFERTAGYYLPVAAGATVVFARSVSELMADLATVRPSVLISVPRIYERAYVKLQESLTGRPLARALYSWTVALGWHRFEHAQRRHGRPSLLARMLWPLLDRIVAAQLRGRFGGRVRAAVAGGATLSLSVSRPFLACGICLLQGYGMTESAPVIACNTPEDNDPTSVGRALPGVEVKIGERQELLVRGRNVMVGYWQRPAETAQVIDAEGWLHTGDQARLEAGRIYIAGRIKEIIVTSTGEKIAPMDLESAILADPTFEQVMVLGEGRPFIAALVVLDRAAWQLEAPRLGLGADDAAALQSEAARTWALGRIATAVAALPAYARPRAVWLSLERWTIGAALITPTLKPKRGAIEQRFAGEIAALYRGHGH
jgi:long-chain acyl-CoA synthetase